MKKKLFQMIGLMRKLVESNEITCAEIEYFSRWLSYFQHERLVHLVVTALTALLTMLSLILFVYMPCLLTGTLMIVLLVLTAAYLYHYYYLENGVQLMYDLMDKLYKKTAEKS